MLIVYVPAGVPAGTPLAPPPLQATEKRIKPAANTSVAAARRPRCVPAVIAPNSSSISRQAAHSRLILRIASDGGVMRIWPIGGAMVRSAVEMPTVTVVPPAIGVTGFAEKLQLVSFGRPVQLKFTGWLNPAIGDSRMVYEAVPPAVIDAVGVTAPIEKSAVCTKPVPVSSTICGLPGALSVMVKAPTLEAVDVGLNVTLMVQLVVGCSAAATQLSLSAKLPLAVMLENVIADVPSFVAVMLSGADVVPTATLPKSRLDADSVKVEAVPVKLITCGLFGAESVIVMVALLTPGVVGLNVAMIVHVAPGFSEEGAMQVEEAEIKKAPGFAPPSVMLEIVSGLSPFVNVTVIGALVVFKLCAENVSADGLSWMPLRMLTLETNASQFPPGAAWTGFETGKFVEHVWPTTYADPEVSTAMPFPLSVCVPPR